MAAYVLFFDRHEARLLIQNTPPSSVATLLLNTDDVHVAMVVWLSRPDNSSTPPRVAALLSVNVDDSIVTAASHVDDTTPDRRHNTVRCRAPECDHWRTYRQSELSFR